MTIYHYVIIGNGAAGMNAAEIIRRMDSHGRITIITNEPHYHYSRPGIAYYLMGLIPEQQLISRSESFYRNHKINLRFGHVRQLDPDGQLIFLADGEPIAYDVLLLATGAEAIKPTMPGSDLDGVVTLDTLDDAKRILRNSRRAKSAVVVGGGITAMELAEGLNSQGVRTHLLQRRTRIWPRLFDEWESKIIERKILHEGIELHYQEEVDTIIGKRDKVAGVRLKSGRSIKCQLVGVAIGVRPNTQLVQGLPIEIDKGILVNQYMQSNIPSIFAAGDVAQVYDRWTDRHQLDILWPSAINEGRAAGYNMVSVARGDKPAYSFQKDSPFNCALLFGIHLTVIGQVGNRSEEDISEISYLSRGSSHVWTAPFMPNYRSAWDEHGPNSLRIVMSNGRLVGALLLGNQELADPLRHFIDREVDLSNYESALLNGDRAMPQTLLKAWRVWHQSWQ